MKRHPDFLIVGAQKCGTGTLHRWLSDHPGCFMSRLKEPHYFTRFKPIDDLVKHDLVVRDEKKYQELFSAARTIQKCGESSPSYLFEDRAAERIFDSIPDCRIVITLRDPVERAFSEYTMYVMAGYEKRLFNQAILEDVSIFPRKSWSDFPLYLELGCFGSQVKKYYDVFPHHQIMVITLDDIIRDKVRLMEKLSIFLAIDGNIWRSYDFPVRHGGRIPRNSLAKYLLASDLARSAGRLFIPHKYRQVLARHVFGKKYQRAILDEEVTEEVKKIIWKVLKEEIILLEQVTGTRFPDLWKSFTDAE